MRPLYTSAQCLGFKIFTLVARVSATLEQRTNTLELHRFCCFLSIFRETTFLLFDHSANKIWLLRFVSSACTAGRIKLVYIVFWRWYELFTVFPIQARRKGRGFIRSTTSPRSIVAPKTDQSKCLIRLNHESKGGWLCAEAGGCAASASQGINAS